MSWILKGSHGSLLLVHFAFLFSQTMELLLRYLTPPVCKFSSLIFISLYALQILIGILTFFQYTVLIIYFDIFQRFAYRLPGVKFAYFAEHGAGGSEGSELLLRVLSSVRVLSISCSSLSILAIGW